MNKHNLSISNFNGKIIVFCCKCFFFSLAMLFFFVFLVLPEYSQHYVGATIDKVERLTSINQPKIVLVGNSSLAFGINSELIEEAMGMPVVNLGMHGGLGNAFHEEMAKLNVCKGDIYIICHTEYSDNDTILDRELACITLENHIQLWKILRGKDVWPLLEAVPTYLHKSFNLWIRQEGNKEINGNYSRKYFNKYGDYILERQKREIDFTEGMIAAPTINDTCIDRLNKLNEYFTNRGATMVVAAYAIPVCEFTPDETEYETFQAELEERLDSPVISNFTEYMLDQDYFYDTQFHLNNEGVDIRTQLLIKDLKRWKNQEGISWYG